MLVDENLNNREKLLTAIGKFLWTLDKAVPLLEMNKSRRFFGKHDFGFFAPSNFFQSGEDTVEIMFFFV